MVVDALPPRQGSIISRCSGKEPAPRYFHGETTTVATVWTGAVVFLPYI